MISFLMMAIQAAAGAAVPPAPPTPPWTPVAGEQSLTVRVPSREGNARLAVRCDARDSKIVSLQFSLNAGEIGPGQPRPVSLTVDTGSPLIANWDIYARAAVESEDMAVTTLTTAIAHGKTIKVHTNNLVGESVDATFDGPTSDAPIVKVLAACGYTLGQPPARTPAPAATPTPSRSQ